MKLTRSQCDERRPICFHCSGSRSVCVYDFHAVNRQENTLSSHATPQSVAVSSPGDGQSLQSLQTTGLNLLHLELLHHFCTETYKTFSPDPRHQHIWQVTAIKYGLEFPFLMSELLAISALHLAHDNPLKRDYYHTEATKLQNESLQTFNRLNKSVNEENVGALLLFASMLSLHLFASPLPQPSPTVHSRILSHMVQSVKMMQNVHGLVIHDWLGHLHTTDLAAFFNLPDVPVPFQVVEQLQSLTGLTTSSSPPVREACDPAIDRLLWHFALSNVPPEHHDTIRWLLGWPAQLNKAYMEELDNHTPEAYVVLAYYALLLHFYKGSWAIGNAGAQLLKAIDSELGESWEIWLKWPKSIVGL